MNLIETTVYTTKSYNIIEKCFQILKLIIEESEKNGTAGLKSHNGLLKNSISNFKVVSSTVNDLLIRIYSNTTIFELKEILSRKVFIAKDFLRIKVKDYEIQTSDHGNTVGGLGLMNDDVLICDTNGLELKIPNKELVKDGEIVPELVQIFKGWFERFSTDGKMSREECGKFIKELIANKDPIEGDDSKVSILFRYDEDKDGFLEESDVLKFYFESTFTKPKIVWENLKNMKVRNDLKNVNLF